MLIPKGSSTVPTDQQLVIIFMNNLTGHLQAVTRMMGAEDGALPEEAPVVRAVAQWTRMRFYDATGDRRRAQQVRAQFDALRNEAISDPSGAQAIGLLEAGRGTPVFLR